MGNNLREELIKFCDRIKDYEHESGHSIYNDERESSEFVDIFLNDSHSPTIEQRDTLQEGDWFQGTEEEYKKVLKLENHTHYKSTHKVWIQHIVNAGGCLFDCGTILWHRTHLRKTKLTPEEFLRRAENTFKM